MNNIRPFHHDRPGLRSVQRTAQLCDAFFITHTIQKNVDLSIGRIAFAGLALDVFDNQFAGCLSCPDHSSLHKDENESKSLFV